MIELKGKYNTAKIFTDFVESSAQAQILELCNLEIFKDSKIRIMPDVHAGAGCTIGTTMTIKDKVVANLVGVDINCGVLSVNLGKVDIDLQVLDGYIISEIPSGTNVHDTINTAGYIEQIVIRDLKTLICRSFDEVRAIQSIGTLGSGNHYIELAVDSKDNKWLSIHSGSRNLGKTVADYYQNLAKKELTKVSKKCIIDKLKSEGRTKDIQEELAKVTIPYIPKGLEYLKGQNFKDYMHDVAIVSRFADINRSSILNSILIGLVEQKSISSTLDFLPKVHTRHNYLDTVFDADDNGNLISIGYILRKGAVSARANEMLLIPINMRDGTLLCKGRGNIDWNFSAPHGAGRLMSRRGAKDSITMDEFEKSMEGIYTTSVNQSTIDESPMAYKSMEDIISNIGDTVEVIDILKPIYNFKSGG